MSFKSLCKADTAQMCCAVAETLDTSKIKKTSYVFLKLNPKLGS